MPAACPRWPRSPEAYPGRLEVIHGDALDLDWAAHLTPPVRIVANLPYKRGNRASGALADAARLAAALVDHDADVPARGGRTQSWATPGSKAYGRLAILAQWRSTARIAMTLPPEAFTPPPKVRSAVVHLEALDAPRYPADPQVLSRIVAAAFNQRRKMLRAALKAQAPDIEDRLRTAGIDPTARAEEISLEAFCALARELA